MVRPILVPNSVVSTVKITQELDDLISDIASIETNNSGHLVTKQQLIRDALKFVYMDGERMRECFRRSRVSATRKKRFK